MFVELDFMKIYKIQMNLFVSYTLIWHEINTSTGSSKIRRPKKC